MLLFPISILVCGLSTIQGQDTYPERSYPNPAFVNVAPCPCDLTQNACDINCCCDEECTDVVKNSFSFCIPGLPGGLDPPLPQYDCNSNHALKDDWFTLMCVWRQYNALLGYFYSNSLRIEVEQNFNKKLEGVEIYSYREEESRSSRISTTSYQSDSYVTSIQEASGTLPEYRVPLVLPHRVLSGQCTLAAPVKYLEDTTSDCLFDFTQDACSIDGSFNALFYVESSNVSRAADCSNPFVILGTNGLVNQTVAVSSVDYHCTSDFTPYIKDTQAVLPMRPTTNTTFNYVMPDIADQDECGNDIVTDFNAIATSPSSGTTLPPLCTFNEPCSRPPTPTYNAGTGTCNNAVLEVRYTFYWSGSQILEMNATVIMGNVPVNTQVTQKFSTEFVHSFTGSTADTRDDYLGQGTAFERSGRPGYEIGKPLLTGSAMTLTDGAFYVNQNTTRQMALWETDVNGLCFNANRKPILFGENMFTSCDIYLQAENLNCDYLRRLLINRLNNLMAADRIGRFGNNNPYDSSHWITVLSGNLSYVCERPENLTDVDVIANQFSGMCSDIVTGINLEIMYAETGRANTTPIYEVVGAAISYTNVTLNMTCGTSGDPACQGNGVQAFPIHSTVNFIKVSAQTPPRIDMWEESYDESICGRDVCWEELIYPLSSAYDGDPQFALAMVLIMILFLVGYLMLIRPWWSINI